MLNRQEQAQQLRAVLVPHIESNGIEQEVACRDGTTRRYRGMRLGGFVLYYETPSHRNPRPIPSCWDEAVYQQVNPIADYSLIVKFLDRPDDPEKSKQVTMFSACWWGKDDAIHVTSFASNESRWYDILFALVELDSKAAEIKPAQTAETVTSSL